MRLGYLRMGHLWIGSATLSCALLAAPVVLAQPDPDDPTVAPAEPASEEGAPEIVKADDSPADGVTEGAAGAEGAEVPAGSAPAAAPGAAMAPPGAATAPPLPPGAQVPGAYRPPPGALAHDTRYVAVRPKPEEPEPEEPTGPYVPHWMSAEVGVRNFVIFNDGFEPYSEDGFMAQGAFAFNFVPFHFGDFALGLTAEYDVGQSSHHIRNIDSSMTLHRLGAGVHAQYLFSRLRLFARVTPGAWHAQGSINDDAFERPLAATKWTWGIDATAGLAVRIGSAGGPSNDRAVRFWLLAELGYGFAGKMDMAFSPEEDEDDPRIYGAVDLPSMRPSGLVNRLALALSF